MYLGRHRFKKKCKSLLQRGGRHMYKHESENNWIGICNGSHLGSGWCIGDDSTFTNYEYRKIIQLKKTDIKVECNFNLI